MIIIFIVLFAMPHLFIHAALLMLMLIDITRCYAAPLCRAAAFI